MSEIDGIVAEFLVESTEGLDQLDQDLVALEQTPGDHELLARIFRVVHTIKGTCGFLGFGRLEGVAHAGENLMSLLRDGKLQLTAEIATGLLHLVDTIRTILAGIDGLGTEPAGDDTALVAELEALQSPSGNGTQPKARSGRKRAAASPAVESVVVAETHQPADLPPAPAVTSPEPTEQRATAADSTIRVDVGLLDNLMNLVGELVLARNQMLQHITRVGENGLQATWQRLDLITTELQESVMKTRMQPIGNVWNKFPRVIRDLAVNVGKSVHLEMEGEQTELDKTIIEAIKDPLTHLVRNAVDHGIESPEKRRAAGKPEEGTVSLRAFHEGGQVNIEMADDGAGIDPERIRRKAVERGLVSADQASRMSDREALGLIFLAGLSTAAQVTNVSGRGVGMDVVKTNIEKIGGSVDAQSRLDAGTTFKIKIPLTLAIIPALIVTTDGDRYAIPQVNLLELVRLEGERTKTGIERIHGAPVYRLRGRLLPLVYLDAALKLGRGACATNADAAPTINIVVLQAGDRQFGLVVDQVSDTEDIVVKPLGKQLKGITAFAGATIMGDGRVALILDVLGLAQRAGVVTEVRDRVITDRNAVTMHTDERESLLLVEGPDGGALGITLAQVSRLEKFPLSAVEHAGGREMVQYRGGIMPLVRVGKLLNGRNGATHDESRDPLHVIVAGNGHGNVGVVVGRIIDTVETVVAPTPNGKVRGVLGTQIVRERVTELLDLNVLLHAAHSENRS